MTRFRTARTDALGLAALLLVLALAAAGCSAETSLQLGKPEQIADGVQLFRLNDANLLDPPGAVAVQILRLDPARVNLLSALAQGHVMGLETVPDIAKRHEAIAAVNAGFFIVKNGDPAGLLKVHGELVSDAPDLRGAVGILRPPGKPIRLLFDRVNASVVLRYRLNDEEMTVPIDGVDTTRVRSRLMLYTPSFGADSDTAAEGVEWGLAGKPLRVLERHDDQGKTPIPRDGFVLSYGGTILPTGLEKLNVGQRATLEPRFQTGLGTLPEQWADAADIVGGAGLLVFRGRVMQEWADERLRAGFDTERHPRTMIGTSANGTIWIITVDGRNPAISLGMTFKELQTLATGMNLTNVLNLDGGGSTTMVVRGQIVNHPSDKTGPRRISDGLVVVERGK
jgi:hypothetical protein